MGNLSLLKKLRFACFGYSFRRFVEGKSWHNPKGANLNAAFAQNLNKSLKDSSESTPKVAYALTLYTNLPHTLSPHFAISPLRCHCAILTAPTHILAYVLVR